MRRPTRAERGPQGRPRQGEPPARAAGGRGRGARRERSPGDYYDGLSRSSGARERDLSPLSDRTFRSSQQGARPPWARPSLDAHRLAI
jgi:hypothetical protein